MLHSIPGPGIKIGLAIFLSGVIENQYPPCFHQ
jgi:hypothetical protein